MIKKYTAALLALMMTAALCACEADDIPAENSSQKQTEVSVTTAAAETTMPDASVTESAPDNAEMLAYDEKPSADDELATIRYLADTFVKALYNQDYEMLTDISAIDALYFAQNGTTGTRDQYLETMKEIARQWSYEEDDVVRGIRFQIDDIETMEESEDFPENFNSFFRKLEEKNGEPEETFRISGPIYDVLLGYRDSGESASTVSDADNGIELDLDISGSANINMSFDTPIIKINGEWKCDPLCTLITTISLENES